MTKWIKKSIKGQFLLIMMAVFILAFIGVMSIFTVEKVLNNSFILDRETLIAKQKAVKEIQEHYSKMVFRTRGYLAFESQTELDGLNEEVTALKASIEKFNKLTLNSQETQFASDLGTFVSTYSNQLVPHAIMLMQNHDVAGLQNLSLKATGQVNNFLDETTKLADFYEQSLRDQHDRYMQKFNLLNWFLFVYVLFLLLIIYIAIRKLTKDIAEPLEALSATSKQIAAGENADLVLLDREDELGILSTAFVNMVKTLQLKEEDLSSQNEELMAQQEELTLQKIRQQDSMREINSLNLALNESAIVSITDPKGKIVFANDKFCEISKYSRDQLLGSDYRVVNSGYHSKEFFAELWNTIQNGRIWKGEIRNQAADGSYYWLDTTIVPYLNEDGEPYQYISIRTDITKIKSTEEQLKRSLEEVEKNRNVLLNLNRLNHALSLTLNKHDLLKNIVHHLTKVFELDKSMIALLNGQQDYAAVGVPTEQVKRFMNEIHDGVVLRLKSTGEPHVIQRAPQVYEQGYHDDQMYCFDLYTPIFDSNHDLIAVFISTRIGRRFSTDEQGELMGIMNRIALSFERIYLYEVTESNRQLNQDIIDNVNEGIQLISSEGKLVQYNRKFYEMLGFHDKDCLQEAGFDTWLKTIVDQVEEGDDFERTLRDIFTSRSQKSSKLQYRLENPNRVIEVYAEPIYRENKKIGTLLVHRDITAEHEVDMMKSELVSTVSHELRTPLSSILGFTELMLNRELKPDRQKKYLETIHKEAKRLTNLINDFLDLQRMESGRQLYAMERLDIGKLVEEVVDTFRVSNAKHHFVIHNQSVHPIIQGDSERLVQLFTNLLSNAVKFSPEGGNVTIFMENNDQRQLVIHLKDEGLGIPGDELPKLFDKFHRVNHTDRQKIGGTGLGLAICKEIVSAHNGTIEVESQLGCGSDFIITYPTEVQQDLNHEGTPIEQETERKALITLVEDDLSLAMLLKEELTEAGYYVRHFVSGEAAIHDLRKNIPEAVVVDLMLEQGLNGWNVIEEIKADPLTRSIPIFISSALDEKEKGKALGAKEYLIKPYPPSKLTEMIAQTILLGQKNGQILIPKE